jgi:hypothetical protein
MTYRELEDAGRHALVVIRTRELALITTQAAAARRKA